METEQLQSKPTMDQYQKLSSKEKVAYITRYLGLKDNYLIGRVTIHPNNDYFLVRNLRNPYTGKSANVSLLKDVAVSNSAICRNAGDLLNQIEDKKEILFRFKENRTIESRLKSGELLEIAKESIIPVSSAKDIFRELNLSLEDVINSDDNKIDFEKVLVMKDFYSDVLKDIVKEKINKLDNETNALDLEKVQLEQEKKILNDSKKEMTIVAEKLEKLGFNFSSSNEGSKQNNEEDDFILTAPNDESDRITILQEQLSSRGLDYDYKTIRQFYCAVKTNQLIILSGPSGTGKTSLVKNFADITGSKSKIIPVQPSWTDKQDLLGFYNPLQKQYVPTNFLDALVDAADNPDVLHFICLDELNLARIEYYLADILSIREVHETSVELYSRYEYEQNLAEIKWVLQKKYPELNVFKKENNIDLKIDTLEDYNLVKTYNNLNRYKWYVDIPENVRFIGTMNIDGTVRPLSPKVVDRSFVINIDKQEYTTRTSVEKGVMRLGTADLTGPVYTDELNLIKSRLERSLINPLQELRANYNRRVDKHISQYMACAKVFNLPQEELLDELISLKILPRINYYIESDMNKNNSFDLALKELTGSQSYSSDKVKYMNEQASRTKIFSYWS